MLQKNKLFFNLRNFIFFFSLIAAWPCVFTFMGWLPDWKTNLYILLFMSVLYAVIKNALYVPTPISTLIILQIFVWILYFIIHFDSSYLTRIFVLVITYCILGIQYKYKRLEFVNVFNSWIYLQVILGGVGFLLVTANLLPVISTFTEFDGRPGAFYGLFTTNVFGGGLCRNAGFFDEPGALACWGMYALLFNKLFIGNKKTEIGLIIGLISTLSLAFFIQIPVYLVLFYKKKRKQVLIICLLVFVALKGLSMVSSVYNDAIFGRLQYNEETGSIKGDNRVDQVAPALALFCTSPLFGVGASNLGKNDHFLGANIFGSLAADGIIGLLILYSPLLMLLWLGRKKAKYKYAVIILLLGFYQRPYGAPFVINAVVLFSFVMYAYFDIYKREELRQQNGVLIDN